MNKILNPSNNLFLLAKSGKRIPHIAAAIPLSFVIVILGMIIGDFIPYPKSIINGLTSNLGLQISIKESFQNITQFFPIILVLLIWLHFYEKRSFRSLGFPKESSLKNYSLGLLIGIIMFSGLIAIVSITGYYTWENGKNLLQGSTMFFPVFIAFLGYFIQGATEEIIFRGWLMNVIGARYKPWMGIAISSILFGLLHGLNPNISILALINLVLFGLFLALYALHQGNLWGVCAWHSIWNWLQGNFFGLEVSGNSESPTILNLKEIGPDWFTGGNFGPEGGLACTIVLLFGVVFCLKINTKKE
jgi:uncharacterized protein